MSTLLIVRRRRAAGGGFLPTDIAGLQLWLDADALVGLSDSDPVSSWTDMSGNGKHAVQGMEGLQPLYKTGIQNGKPVVRFDGSDDKLTAPITGDASVSLFVVAVKRTAASASSRILAAFGGATGAAIYSNSGDGAGWLWYPGPGVVAAFGGTVTDWVLLEMIFASASSVTPYRNGVAGSAFNPDAYDDETTLSLGAEGGIGMPGDYDFAEIILYDSALDTTDRESVESYLTAKWGL